MKFNEIISQKTLTPEQANFVRVHQEIMRCGQLATHAFIEMATRLKEMRDGKLYHAAEYETFGEYVENACGIKERQAYNYITVLENLPRDYLQSNANLGVTKLVLLAGLTGEEREEVSEIIDVESATVRELRAVIDEQTKKIQQLEMDLDGAANEPDPKQAEKDAAAIAELKKQIANLKKDVKEQKTIAADKEADASDLRGKLDDAIARETELRNRLAAKEKEQSAASSAEVQQLKDELAKARRMSTLAAFKVKYGEFQRIGEEAIALIKEMDEDAQARCNNAMRAAITGMGY